VQTLWILAPLPPSPPAPRPLPSLFPGGAGLRAARPASCAAHLPSFAPPRSSLPWTNGGERGAHAPKRPRSAAHGGGAGGTPGPAPPGNGAATRGGAGAWAPRRGAGAGRGAGGANEDAFTPAPYWHHGDTLLPYSVRVMERSLVAVATGAIRSFGCASRCRWRLPCRLRRCGAGELVFAWERRAEGCRGGLRSRR